MVQEKVQETRLLRGDALLVSWLSGDGEERERVRGGGGGGGLGGW